MLPINAATIYTLQIPSSKKEFKYRQFFVREEKSLLIAQQSENPIVMLDTIKNVIKSCANSDIDIDKLASFDIEYIFLQMRAVSVGEFVDLIFSCDEDHGVDNEKAKVKLTLDIRDAKVVTNDSHISKIPLFRDVGVVLKYPTITTMKKFEESTGEDIDQIFEIVTDCIDYIYDANEVYPAKDQTPAEIEEFLNNLTSDQFEKIHSFFTTLPALRLPVKYTCPICKKEYDRYLEGLSSFF